MKNAIICSESPVTLVGGGEVGDGDLEQALRLAPLLVAADGGASHALAAGLDLSAVIGDFDSLSPKHAAKIPADRLFPIREQDTTDFDKALRHISAPLILAVGFLGARVDHQLAAFNVLAKHPERPCVLIGSQELVFHVPPVFELNLTPGDIVSLFPMTTISGRSGGLEWPIDGLALSPTGRTGTSNRATGPVRLWMDGPGLLAIVPRTALRPVMQAFQTVPNAPGAP